MKKQQWLIVGIVGGTFAIMAFMLCGGVITVAVLLYNKKQKEENSPKPEMDLPAYAVQRPKGGATVTGECEISQSDDFIGIHLRADGKSEFCFADRDSQAGRDLLAALGDGKKHELTLAIKPVTYKNQMGWEMDGSKVLKVVSKKEK